MLYIKPFIVLFVIATSLYSYHKDGNCDPEIADLLNNDTIHPSEYLGAYPGSWREYDNGGRQECNEWRSIAKYSNILDDDGCLQISREYVILPRMNSSNIHGDYILHSNDASHTSSLLQNIGALGNSWGHTVNFD
ncbi:MAG: hypothetical protein ACI8ZM_000165 [Crocinitomix sp.]|jgi:hypothetical protein